MLIPYFTKEELSNRTVNNSAGEFLVLNKLNTIASQERDWIIYRSLRLENHPNKIEGEIDVVIFTQTQGIILLEIKGSELCVADGKWTIFNRGKQSWESIQDPFEQMKDGLFAFKKENGELFRLFRINPLISWGCIFPESHGIRGTISYPSWRFCNADKLNDIDLFIDQLVKKERNKLSNLDRRSMGASMERKIILCLLEKMTPLNEDSKYITLEYNERLIELNKETQLVHNLMRAFSSNKFIFAEGAAGTGKTRAAIFECKRLHNSSKSFLFWCKSKFLAENLTKWLSKELEDEKSRIWFGDDLPKEVEILEIDALIIDEAQDLVHLNHVKNYLLEFYKCNKLIRLFGDFDFQNLFDSKSNFLEWIHNQNMNPSFSRLSINCRNTMQIGGVIRKIADFDDSIFSLSSTQGESLKIFHNIPEAELHKKVNECISLWRNKDYPESAITVLLYKDIYPLENESTLLYDINGCYYAQSELVDNKNKVNFTNVIDFKGLEAPCIILIVNDIDDDWQHLFYIAISRARLNCYVIFIDKITNLKLQEILCKI